MRTARVVVGAAGIALLGYGLLLAGGLGAQLVDVGVWVAGGILLHDGVLAPAVVVLGVLAARLAPEWLRPPLVRLVVVLGPLTLVAVPVLGRFGARADNPTLLDRPYVAGWWAVAALAVAATAAGALRRRGARPQRVEEPDRSP